MSRVVSEDYKKLFDFFSNYSVKANFSKKEFVTFLSAYHKKYLAYLTFVAEISTNKGAATLKGLSEKQCDFIAESCSDCGLAMFEAVSGNYKGARLLLRSSIENYMKGASLDEDGTIDQESSVYELFNRAKATVFFTQREHLKLFDVIHQEYKALCRDVHTATTANMALVSALNTFPTFNQKFADGVLKTVKRLIESYVTLLAMKYNEYYHGIGYENKEVIENAVLKDFAELIYNKR